MSEGTKDSPKQYDLTALESQMLGGIRDQQQATMASVLNILLDKRAYRCTPYTMMEVDAQMRSIKVYEATPDVPATEGAKQPDTAAGVKEAGDDAKAV